MTHIAPSHQEIIGQFGDTLISEGKPEGDGGGHWALVRDRRNNIVLITAPDSRRVTLRPDMLTAITEADLARPRPKGKD